MNVAIKFGALRGTPVLTEDGTPNTESGQSALAQRLLDMYPGAVLVGPERAQGRDAQGRDVQVVTLDDLDPTTTLVINLDVLDSVGIFQRLHRDGAEPMILNFQAVNPTTFNHPVNFAAMGLSYAFFPTFCAGERVAGEVREVIERWATPEYRDRAKVAWADLGVGTGRQIERREAEEPIVLYPAISMEARKQPAQFLKIVTAAQKQTPFRVVARLAQSHLIADQAMALARNEWASVGPLRAQRDDYWNELARTTAFLATSLEEAYGLEYVEALMAGAIGIFPERAWVHHLVPEGYPFIYNTPAEAQAMLVRAVQNPDACRAEMDALVGGSFTDWVRGHHDRRDFVEVFSRTVKNWFGEA